MPLDTATRNELRRVVQRAREVLTQDLAGVLEATFGIHENGTIEEIERLPALRDDSRNRETRDLLETVLRGSEGTVGRAAYRERYETLVRSLAFTHLNRLVAFRIMEHPDIGLIEPSVERWERARGFLRFAGRNPEVGRLYDRGDIDEAYRHYLLSLCARLDREIGVLFDPDDLASRIFPSPRALRQVLELLDRPELHDVWSEEETIGWVYQFYTPKEQREQARRESSAPRNAYEMAFLNQFYTPDYVVRFLVDNTLGRIWLEMRQGGSTIDGVCSLMVRRPDEVFLNVPSNVTTEAADWRTWLLGLVTPPPGQEVAFGARREDIQRIIFFAHAVNGYRRHPFEDEVEGEWWPWWRKRAVAELEDLGGVPTQDLLDILFAEARGDRYCGGGGEMFIEDPVLLRIANEAAARIRRALDGTDDDAGPAPTLVPKREPKDPRKLRVLDPACGSGHFLSYAFDVLRRIYLEAWEDLDSALRKDYPDRETFERTLPTLILEHNLYGIDIDRRATQLASLVLFLKAKAAHPEAEVHRVNVVCAEPMPGDRGEFEEFLKSRLGSESGVVARILSSVWESLRQAGELGSVLRLDEEISGAIRKEHEAWRRLRDEGGDAGYLFPELAPPDQLELDFSDVRGERFWKELEARIENLLRGFAEEAAGAEGLRRRLFAENSVEGFHFVEVMRRRFDVVLMNPPFGAAPVGAQKYIKDHYPRSKQDIYAVFVERFLERLEPGGRLGAITSRTGFFLSTYQRWREDVVLGEAHPVLLADLGHGVMDDAMVEAAAYVLERAR